MADDLAFPEISKHSTVDWTFSELFFYKMVDFSASSYERPAFDI